MYASPNSQDTNDFLAQFHVLKEEAKVKDPDVLSTEKGSRLQNIFP